MIHDVGDAGAGRQLDRRQLRRLGAHGRADGQRAQLRPGGRRQDTDAHARTAAWSRRRPSRFRRAAARRRRSPRSISRPARIASRWRSTPADDLSADDQRYLALKRPQPRNVLVVAADPRGRGALFTSAALGTLATLALTPDAQRRATSSERPLTDYSFVVVTDAGARPHRGGAAPGLCQQRRARIARRRAALGGSHDGAAHAARRCARRRADGARPRSSIGEIDTTHPALRGVDELRAARFSRWP